MPMEFSLPCELNYKPLILEIGVERDVGPLAA